MSDLAVVGLSLRKYAEHRKALGLSGGTLRAVQKAIERGAIVKLPGGRIDPEDADRRWDRHSDPEGILRRDSAIAAAAVQAASKPGAGGADVQQAQADGPEAEAKPSKAEAPSPTAQLAAWKAKLTEYQAERARAERDLVVGRSLDSDEVHASMAVMGAEVKSFLLNFVNDVSPELAAVLKTDERKTWIEMDRIFKKQLAKLASVVEDLAA